MVHQPAMHWTIGDAYCFIIAGGLFLIGLRALCEFVKPKLTLHLHGMSESEVKKSVRQFRFAMAVVVFFCWGALTLLSIVSSKLPRL